MMDFLKDDLPADSCCLLYLFSPRPPGGLSCTGGGWWQVRGALQLEWGFFEFQQLWELINVSVVCYIRAIKQRSKKKASIDSSQHPIPYRMSCCNRQSTVCPEDLHHRWGHCPRQLGKFLPTEEMWKYLFPIHVKARDGNSGLKQPFLGQPS